MLDCQTTPATAATTKGNPSSKNHGVHQGDEQVIQCKYCQESGDNLGCSEPVYWGIQLDQDLLETLLAIYPEWFKDYNLNVGSPSSSSRSATTPSALSPPAMAEGGTPQGFVALSPPKAEVDETPIHKTMDKHKESLKVKLLLRRPINELVDQGIMPPLKTPPGFHEQRQKLERAKMGDLLKSKIQRRPDRQELIQQHILEDSNVDPSLQDKQRQLKKARLADDLNERLSHRPGPLELIKGNILKADEELARAIKDGQITFKRTCEGETRKHPPPPFVFEEDSSSEGAMSPVQECEHSPRSTSVRSPPSAGGVPSPSIGSAVSSLSPVSSVASPPGVLSPALATAFGALPAIPTSAAVTVVSPTCKNSPYSMKAAESGKDQNRSSRKKSKSKSMPKTRTIKFHEYKGPPNAQKNLLSSASQVETSYELLLQQQQLFLQWQLELQHKYPQIILPAAHKMTNSESGPNSVCLSPPGQTGTVSQPLQQDVPPTRCLSKLEDMKVSDLKLELKKRNLPVSGSKPQLIERLKPYTDAASSPTISALVNGQVSSSSVTNGVCSEISSGPSSLTFDTSSQGSPAEDASVAMHVEGDPISPVDGLDHDSLETSLAETTTSDAPYRIAASPPFLVGGIPTTLHRPPSVAPMEVDGNSNSGFDPMDVSDIGRNLPQVPFSRAMLQCTSPASLMSAIQDPSFFSNLSPSNEEILKKKIEELQRELQKSQLQLQQQQQRQNQSKFVPQSQVLSPVATAVVTVVSNPVSPQEVKMSTSNGGGITDLKAQQKLMIQQNLQQKIQQQQLMQLQQQQQQQQQAASSGSSAASPSVKASLAAFLQGQGAPNSLTQQPKVYFKVNNNGLALEAALHTVTNLQTEAASAKQRANSLPNGLGAHVRTNSLPNFAGLTTGVTKQPISRTTTDPHFSFAKPPPDYNEATKQLNKRHFAQTLIETLSTPPGGRKSVKSQAVDDVLEILIKNGELPPSAAQEPPTPPTPKSLPGGLMFPSTVSTTSTAPGAGSTGTTAVASSSPVSSPSSEDRCLPANDASRIPFPNGVDANLPPRLTDAGIHSPSPSAPTFDLDLSLDLDGLEPMNLEGFGMDGHGKGDCSDFLGSSSASSLDRGVGGHDHPNVGEYVDFDDDGIHMDIDMTDVSDWLDAVLPPMAGGTGGTLPTLTVHHGPNSVANGGSNADCNDPLLSANQDIFNLLNLDDDFKAGHDLGTLMWDKVDFAT